MLDSVSQELTSMSGKVIEFVVVLTVKNDQKCDIVVQPIIALSKWHPPDPGGWRPLPGGGGLWNPGPTPGRWEQYLHIVNMGDQLLLDPGESRTWSKEDGLEIHLNFFVPERAGKYRMTVRDRWWFANVDGGHIGRSTHYSPLEGWEFTINRRNRRK